TIDINISQNFKSWSTDGFGPVCTDEASLINNTLPIYKFNTGNLEVTNVIEDLNLDDPIDLMDDEVPFLVIEEAPVFNGCENLSKNATKKCFTKKITQFIQRNFNTELAQDLGLKKGKHKIYTQFLIDKTGFITEIKIRAPHKRLEKEARRIVKKIPRFAPGKQRGRPVKVRYTLPISFMVE
ncbi:MAG: energy transducer TonB, partial [Flavobacteriaceae bacterium]